MFNCVSDIWVTPVLITKSLALYLTFVLPLPLQMLPILTLIWPSDIVNPLEQTSFFHPYYLFGNPLQLTDKFNGVVMLSFFIKAVVGVLIIGVFRRGRAVALWQRVIDADSLLMLYWYLYVISFGGATDVGLTVVVYVTAGVVLAVKLISEGVIMCVMVRDWTTLAIYGEYSEYLSSMLKLNNLKNSVCSVFYRYVFMLIYISLTMFLLLARSQIKYLNSYSLLGILLGCGKI